MSPPKEIGVDPKNSLEIIRRDQHEALSEAEFRSLAREAIYGMKSAPDLDWIYSNCEQDRAVESFRDLYQSGNLLICSFVSIRQKRNPDNLFNKYLYKIFHLCKSILQIKKYGAPKDNIREPWREVEREYFIQKAASDLNEAFKQVCIDDADKIQLVRELMEAAGLPKLKIVFSGSSANKERKQLDVSELWSERPSSSKEDPAKFIIRVYDKYLDEFITWGDIRRSDEKLYYSYSHWSAKRPTNPNVLYVNSKILNRTQSANARIVKQLKEHGNGVGWSESQEPSPPSP